MTKQRKILLNYLLKQYKQFERYRDEHLRLLQSL